MTPKEIAAAAAIAASWFTKPETVFQNIKSSFAFDEDTASKILQTARAELAKLGETWRVGEGAEIMDAYQHQQELMNAQSSRISELEAELARVKEAVQESLLSTDRHSLLVGFAHGEPSRNELQERLNDVKAILSASMKGQTHD